MEIKEHYHYFLDTETLFKAFTDPEYHLDKYKYTGAKDVEVLECGQDGDIFRIRTRRTENIDVPKVATRILSDEVVILQKDEWVVAEGKEIVGSYELTIEGTPMATHGEMLIRPHGNGSELEITILAIVKIPVIGKKLAKFLVNDIKKSLALEYEFEMEYLQRWLPHSLGQ